MKKNITKFTSFYEQNKVIKDYYPIIQNIIEKSTGANEVHIYNHTVRIQDQVKREKLGAQRPTSMAHNDYTELCGRRIVEQISSPSEVENRLKKRYAMYNVWRPISKSVDSWPLAICDSSSCNAQDLILTEHIFDGRSELNYRIQYNKNQRWYYFPNMKRNEVIIIKGFDSMTDGRAQYTPHGGANQNDDDTPILRESIEVRAIAFFE